VRTAHAAPSATWAEPPGCSRAPGSSGLQLRPEDDDVAERLAVNLEGVAPVRSEPRLVECESPPGAHGARPAAKKVRRRTPPTGWETRLEGGPRRTAEGDRALTVDPAAANEHRSSVPGSADPDRVVSSPGAWGESASSSREGLEQARDPSKTGIDGAVPKRGFTIRMDPGHIRGGWRQRRGHPAGTWWHSGQTEGPGAQDGERDGRSLASSGSRGDACSP
jgi:hypothetical protein